MLQATYPAFRPLLGIAICLGGCCLPGCRGQVAVWLHQHFSCIRLVERSARMFLPQCCMPWLYSLGRHVCIGVCRRGPAIRVCIIALPAPVAHRQWAVAMTVQSRRCQCDRWQEVMHSVLLARRECTQCLACMLLGLSACRPAFIRSLPFAKMLGVCLRCGACFTMCMLTLRKRSAVDTHS